MPRLKTLNQPPPDSRQIRASPSADHMRFQAVNGGFAAPHTRSRQPVKSPATVRKTAQESQESGRWQKARLFGRWVFKPVHSTALPPFHAPRRRGCIDSPAGSVVVAQVAGEDDSSSGQGAAAESSLIRPSSADARSRSGCGFGLVEKVARLPPRSRSGPPLAERCAVAAGSDRSIDFPHGPCGPRSCHCLPDRRGCRAGWARGAYLHARRCSHDGDYSLTAIPSFFAMTGPGFPLFSWKGTARPRSDFTSQLVRCRHVASRRCAPPAFAEKKVDSRPVFAALLFLRAQASFGPIVLTGFCRQRGPRRGCRLGDEAGAAFIIYLRPRAVAGELLWSRPRSRGRVHGSVLVPVSQTELHRGCLAVVHSGRLRFSRLRSTRSRASLVAEFQARSILLSVSCLLPSRLARAGTGPSMRFRCGRVPRSCRRYI